MSDDRGLLEDQLRYVEARLRVHQPGCSIGTDMFTVWCYQRRRIELALARLDEIKRYDHSEVMNYYRAYHKNHKNQRLHNYKGADDYAMARAQHRHRLDNLAALHGRREDESQEAYMERFEPIMFDLREETERAREVQLHQRANHPPCYDEDDDCEYDHDVPF